MNDVEIKSAAYRLPKSVLDHIDYACKISDLKKTVIVRRALQEYLNAHYPIPSEQAA